MRSQLILVLIQLLVQIVQSIRLRTSSTVYYRVYWYRVIRQRNYQPNRSLFTGVHRRVSLRAYSRNISGQDKSIRATFNSSGIIRRWEGKDGRTASKPDISYKISTIMIATDRLGSVDIYSIKGIGPTHCTTGALCSPPLSWAGILK